MHVSTNKCIHINANAYRVLSNTYKYFSFSTIFNSYTSKITQAFLVWQRFVFLLQQITFIIFLLVQWSKANSDCRSCAHSWHKTTEILWCCHKTLVLQGDTLAPYLFIIVLDYVLRKALDGREEELGFCLKKCQSRRFGPEILTDLDFADDIALLSEQTHQAQNLLNNVEVQCGKIGLKINDKKTKSMVFNHRLPVTLHTLDGSELEIV